MTDRVVQLFGQPIGRLAIVPGGDARFPEDWSFQYLPAYVAGNGVPLSVSLPLRDAPHVGAVARNWFANLLPEGTVRDEISRRLRIAGSDSFALLAAIGGECAGAVSVAAERQAANSAPAEPATSLEEALAEVGEGGWALLGGPMRLSLAGAQDKLAVVRDPTGLRLPRAGEPTTHILKPDSPRLRGLCDLEMLGLALASALGLPVVKAEVMTIAGTRAVLIERYDRVQREGHVERLHQEDFCQALGFPPELKYQSQGGPTLGRCASLIRDQLGLGPQAMQAFLDWVIFAVLIGNADAHGKNLGLLRSPGGRLQLAPWYDLVPTIAWPARILDRTPALSIGGAPAIDRVDRAHWDAFARETQLRPRFVLQRVQALASAAIDALPGVIEQRVAGGGAPIQLVNAHGVLLANCARMLSDAASGVSVRSAPTDGDAPAP